MRDTLAALIKRVETATGPDRRLDAEISAALRRLPEPYDGWPAFTGSLDAALALVPEGWRWSLDYTQRPPYQDCGCATLFAPGSGDHPADVSEVYAATPALALVAAALRARMESADD